jgi:hypothetical protein
MPKNIKYQPQSVFKKATMPEL